MEALHVYVADFFHHEGLEEVCSRQFDETALLAMGESSINKADGRGFGRGVGG